MAAALEQLHAECDKIGRDPSEIHVSATVWMDGDMTVSAAADLAAQRSERGADEVLIYLAPPHTPVILEPLADALAAISANLSSG